MAREARFLHADSLSKAIYEASSLLAQPIDRLEVIGSKIYVGAGAQRVVFEATQSQTYNQEGTPTLGGTSGDAVVISGPEWWYIRRHAQREFAGINLPQLGRAR